MIVMSDGEKYQKKVFGEKSFEVWVKGSETMSQKGIGFKS